MIRNLELIHDYAKGCLAFNKNNPSLERGSLPQLLRHPSKESKAEETRKKGKITLKKL